ncbi:MAG: phosphatidylserine decarboxylase [Myxococcales bacterium FL481]|nr:MAG: phosphatidylserine decarboxylase [Myxococcales bacterium FL481]
MRVPNVRPFLRRARSWRATRRRARTKRRGRLVRGVPSSLARRAKLPKLPSPRRIFLQEDINFLVTNRIPRRLATRFMGWFSKVENPALCKITIAVWRVFSDLDLSDAEPVRYRSLHECFTRRLVPGARPIDADDTVVVSPCDALVGATGRLCGTDLIQAKGFPYRLEELLADPNAAAKHRNGWFVTLRLTSAMYHRFHAPYDCDVERVDYISGDTWNVNPIALRRVERLFCRNERAVMTLRLQPSQHAVTLVAVGAILVASVRLHCLDIRLHGRYRGPEVIHCRAPHDKGQEMGWFEHGSTIVVLAPPQFELVPDIAEGSVIHMGQPLFRLPRGSH